MLTIRLSRKGKKNQPFFRVVVIDKRRSAKGGRSVEDLGYVNPLTKKISLDKERVQYWLKNGAQASSTMHNLLVKEKIIDAKKIHVSKLSKKKQAEIDKKKADEVAAIKAKAEAEAKASADAKAMADKKAEAEAAEKAEAEKPAEQAKPEEPKTDAPTA